MAHGRFCSDGWRRNQRNLVGRNLWNAVLFSQPLLPAHSWEVLLARLANARRDWTSFHTAEIDVAESGIPASAHDHSPYSKRAMAKELVEVMKDGHFFPKESPDDTAVLINEFPAS